MVSVKSQLALVFLCEEIVVQWAAILHHRIKTGQSYNCSYSNCNLKRLTIEKRSYVLVMGFVVAGVPKNQKEKRTKTVGLQLGRFYAWGCTSLLLLFSNITINFKKNSKN